jgi:hypothetical protein
MLAATDPAFGQLYPFGAIVHDATGRELRQVFACNPLTGEVVMWDGRPSPWNWLIHGTRKFRRWEYWRWLMHGGIARRHGFWPAPLTITAIPSER